MKFPQKQSQAPQSLATTLAVSFFTLSAVVLLISAALQIFFNVRSQEEIVTGQQQLLAQDAAKTVSGFVQEKFSVLETAAQLIKPSATSREEQEQILNRLIGLQPALRQVVLLDTQEQPLSQASRLSTTASRLVEQLKDEVLVGIRQHQRYISPVYFDATTSEPLVIMAVPAANALGDLQGTVVSEVNLKFMWDLVYQLGAGGTGEAYVVDRQGRLLAYSSDIARVLERETVAEVGEVSEFMADPEAVDSVTGEIYTGIGGTAVIGTFVPLDTPDWAVVVEQPWAEAYRSVILLGGFAVGGALAIAVLGGLVGVYMARRLAGPLVNLMGTANRITGGELELQAAVAGPAEVSSLALAFNSMTGQLRQTLAGLEEQVTARTHRLEIGATLSERLTSILDLKQLLNELVDQVKSSFAYYHFHVYLLDGQRQKLEVAAGTGEAGATMLAQKHSILLNAPTSLVARAARTGEIVKVDNVRETPDWLPNPLLPDTYSEMAVPITLAGQTVGVLDVQQDRTGGLDEGDANLLRSLANQVAVAMRNARLFYEVETALAEARATQARYLDQSWRQAPITRKARFHFVRPDAPQLAEPITAAVKRQALSLPQAALVTVPTPDGNGSADELSTAPEQAASARTGAGTVLVAPVKLQDKTIGSLQIHPATDGQTWSEDDLAIIEAIADELAQMGESLRLFDEIRERAGREQTLREITDKLRAAPTLEKLMEVAAGELGQRLAATHAQLELGLAADRAPERN